MSCAACVALAAKAKKCWRCRPKAAEPGSVAVAAPSHPLALGTSLLHVPKQLVWRIVGMTAGKTAGKYWCWYEIKRLSPGGVLLVTDHVQDYEIDHGTYMVTQ